MYNLENKVAIVTGGGSGIGQTIALRLADEGAHVVIIGRTEKSLKETAEKHENISYVVADITKTADLERLFSEVKVKFGRLGILVNNAGVAPVTPLESLKMEEYDNTFNINVRGIVDAGRQALPLLKASHGTIINISSSVSLRPMANMSVYSASKAAVSVITKAWAREFSKEGIRVNAVNVGPIWTPIYEKTDLDPEAAKKHIETVQALIPMGRFGTSKPYRHLFRRGVSANRNRTGTYSDGAFRQTGGDCRSRCISCIR